MAVNALYRLRFFWYDLRTAIRAFAVAEQLGVLERDFSRLPALLVASEYIFADGFTFRLGEAAEQGDEELAGFRQRIDIFFFKPCVDEKDTVQKRQNKVK